MSEQYLSFEEVLGELNISEEDLKRMVSEGELRAFRDENKMKFRRDDVANLKSGGGAEPTVVFEGGGEPAGPGGAATEGTILDMDSGELPAAPPAETAVPELDFGGGGEAPAAEEAAAPAEESSAPAPEGETTGITQEMVFEDSDALKVQPSDGGGLGGSESSETFVDESSDTAAGTEGLKVENEPGAAEDGETAVTEEEAPAPRRARAAAGAAAAEAGPALAPAPWATALMFLATAAMALVGFVMVDMVRVSYTHDPTKANSFTQGIRDIAPGKGKPVIK